MFLHQKYSFPCFDVPGDPPSGGGDPAVPEPQDAPELSESESFVLEAFEEMQKDDDGDDDVLGAFDSKVSDQIFYSVNFSLEVFLQQQDRIHRIGQTRRCRYWMLLTNSKIERTIASRLEEKLICNKEILVDIKRIKLRLIFLIRIRQTILRWLILKLRIV